MPLATHATANFVASRGWRRSAGFEFALVPGRLRRDRSRVHAQPAGGNNLRSSPAVADDPIDLVPRVVDRARGAGVSVVLRASGRRSASWRLPALVDHIQHHPDGAVMTRASSAMSPPHSLPLLGKAGGIARRADTVFTNARSNQGRLGNWHLQGRYLRGAEIPRCGPAMLASGAPTTCQR